MTRWPLWDGRYVRTPTGGTGHVVELRVERYWDYQRPRERVWALVHMDDGRRCEVPLDQLEDA